MTGGVQSFGKVGLTGLTGRVEPFLLDRMQEPPGGFTLRRVMPRITPNRFDLGVKLAYLRSLRPEPGAFARGLYGAHIAAFTLGDMVEPGSAEKAGQSRYERDFRALLADMERGGFDPARSLVPLASDGTILNGAHRWAAALHLGLPVMAVETGLEPMRFDYRYFRERGMAAKTLDAAALQYLDAAPDLALALLWPAATGKERAVEAVLPPLAYRKEVRLSHRAAHGLLAQVYAGEPWLGDADAGHPGVAAKLEPCFAGSAPLRALLFHADARIDRVALKERVRALYGIGKHAIHITDTQDEAVRLGRLLFNDTALRFLARGDPHRFGRTAELATGLKESLRRTGRDPASVAVDSGMVMGVHGLRAPGDCDVVAADVVDAGAIDLGAGVEAHGAGYHAVDARALIEDPANHFDFDGLRWVSLDRVAEMKARRQAGRDAEDLVLIHAALSDRQGAFRARLDGIGHGLRLRRARARRALIRLLDRLGLKTWAKGQYHRLRRVSR